MALLKLQVQRLIFRWQQGSSGQRWVSAMLVVVLALAALLGHAVFKRHQLQQALQQLPVAARVSATQIVSPAATAAASAAQALQQWPPEEQANRISAEILAQADALGMIFERAEFQSVAIEHTTLQIQRIKLPLKGDYLQVRQFLNRVLQAYPSLALSQFKLQRSDVMQTTVEAYIEFSLYTRRREPA
ncbi:hypothetical protein [Methylophilus sp.]|uniref:hypothetical protein n=1 Tax=Methylophilus sp. TaxID=29541 RepID=UPI004036AFC9